MCTYVTVTSAIEGSGKGPGGEWFHVSSATTYLDHPVHALAEHTVNIDFADRSGGPAARVAVELTPASAVVLIEAIQAALAGAPEEG